MEFWAQIWPNNHGNLMLYWSQTCLGHVLKFGIWQTDALHATRCIFDLSYHSYQLHSIAVSINLRAFFSKSSSSSITFWNYPSSAKWPLHSAADKETKQFKIDLVFPCKSLWDFRKKEECNSILQQWQMIFQASYYKEKKSLDLIDIDDLPAKPTYSKGGTWFKLIGHSNMLCARVTRAITNHAPIGEYHLRFFPREPFACLYREYPIKSRNHIFHNCRRFNNYWNPNRELLLNFIAFLEFNPGAFSFHEEIT